MRLLQYRLEHDSAKQTQASIWSRSACTVYYRSCADFGMAVVHLALCFLT